jgi:hypothetical protein
MRLRHQDLLPCWCQLRCLSRGYGLEQNKWLRTEFRISRSHHRGTELLYKPNIVFQRPGPRRRGFVKRFEYPFQFRRLGYRKEELLKSLGPTKAKLSDGSPSPLRTRNYESQHV